MYCDQRGSPYFYMSREIILSRVAFFEIGDAELAIWPCKKTEIEEGDA